MNLWVGIGRLTKDVSVYHSQNQKGEATTTARYTLAVDRKGKKVEGQPDADYIPCVAFGKKGEFAEKYLSKGIKIAVRGEIRTGSYTNKDGQKVYTTEVVVDEQEFVESKKESSEENTQPEPPASNGYIDVPEGIMDSLPFK